MAEQIQKVLDASIASRRMMDFDERRREVVATTKVELRMRHLRSMMGCPTSCKHELSEVDLQLCVT